MDKLSKANFTGRARMFIGHFAVALAAKKPAPRASVGTLMMAAQFPDLLWPILLLLGVERVEIAPGNTQVTPLNFVNYPYSHSLLGISLAAIFVAAIYKGLKGYTRAAAIVGIAVFSHWILDAATHRPDLPLYPGGSFMIGFGLWNSRLWTLIVEGAIFVAAMMIYLKATRARDKMGVYSFWAFIVFLVAIYFGNLFGPPPPNVRVLAFSGLGIWLLVAWGYWIDRHREPTAL
jgi:membrane-bound metal-dependent hydrolase YbcI (DUF457 family)